MGTQEVKLEHAGEKSAVDSSDPVCSFIHPGAHQAGAAGERACNYVYSQRKRRDSNMADGCILILVTAI